MLSFLFFGLIDVYNDWIYFVFTVVMARKLKIPGVIVPPVTPFNTDLKVDYAQLEREVNYVIDVGRADAVVAGGVETQEYQYLSFEERKEYITRMLEFVNERCYTVVGVSHPSIKTVKELADFARDKENVEELLKEETLKE